MTPSSQVPAEELARVRALAEIWEREWVARGDVPLEQQLLGLGAGELGAALQPSAAPFRKVKIELELSTNPEDLESPLQMLQSSKWSADILDRTAEGIVLECRRRHYSWADIALALGVSRQSAWTKYASLEDDAG